MLAVIGYLSIFPLSCISNRNIIHKTPSQVPIVFTYRGQDRTVCLSGDFNGWSPNAHCLKRNGDTCQIKLFLSPGRYKYAFLVDGTQWIPDPEAYLEENDGFGMKNSVLIVE
jgi:hypothetical protein